MFENILGWSIEWQKWGLNALIIGSLGIIAFTFIEGWGLWKQKQAIWNKKSGESVSVNWFSYLTFFFVASLFYGIHIASVAVVISGLLAILHIPILVGLWKFKGFARHEKIQFVLFVGMVPAMAFLPWKDELFLIFSFGTLYSLGTQPWELWKTKKTGVVEIRLVGVYFLSTFFWIVYAFAAGEWVLEIITPIALVLLGLTSALWFKYRSRERANAS